MIPRWLPLALSLTAALSLAACSSPQGDTPPDAGPPQPLGEGFRIKDIVNPASPHHPPSGTTVMISGASFVTVDTFDETADGKSVGTVYVEDTNSTAPFSGTSLYEQTYLPPTLRPAPGDVLDLTGAYDVQTSIGSLTFASGQGLIQISKPTVTFRFEFTPPAPAVINVTDLNDYATGLQWEWMLVTVNDITMGSGLQDVDGRVTGYLTSTISGTAVEISNELFDLGAWNAAQTNKLQAGTKLKSLTGVVTWFTQFHIAPRSPADIVME